MGEYVSSAEAAVILGVTRGSVYRMVHRGVLPRVRPHARGGLRRDDVERLALERGLARQSEYWVDSAGAALLLGVTVVWVRRLARKDLLPAIYMDGRWWFRRAQLEVISRARRTSIRAGRCCEQDQISTVDDG